MRVVRSVSELPHAFKTAQREAESAFGIGDVYLEKYVESPRHIEFQVLGDHHGAVVHLGERDCSVQRGHRKLIAEGPAIELSRELRVQLVDAAIQAATAVGYTNVGGTGTNDMYVTPTAAHGGVVSAAIGHGPTVDVHARPDDASPVLGSLADGTRVVILGQTEDHQFYVIEYGAARRPGFVRDVLPL